MLVCFESRLSLSLTTFTHKFLHCIFTFLYFHLLFLLFIFFCCCCVTVVVNISNNKKLCHFIVMMHTVWSPYCARTENDAVHRVPTIIINIIIFCLFSTRVNMFRQSWKTGLITSSDIIKNGPCWRFTVEKSKEFHYTKGFRDHKERLQEKEIVAVRLELGTHL